MITQDEAIAIARQAATERGWRWEEPVRAVCGRSGIVFGREQWEVRTNAECRGCNARFVIDTLDGKVVEAFWLPR